MKGFGAPIISDGHPGLLRLSHPNSKPRSTWFDYLTQLWSYSSLDPADVWHFGIRQAAPSPAPPPMAMPEEMPLEMKEEAEMKEAADRWGMDEIPMIPYINLYYIYNILYIYTIHRNPLQLLRYMILTWLKVVIEGFLLYHVVPCNL